MDQFTKTFDDANVEQISSNVRDTTDMLKVLVPVILQEIKCVTNAAKGNTIVDSVEKLEEALERVKAAQNISGSV